MKNVPKLANARPPVTSVKVRKIKGPNGSIKEQHDLVINIDLVRRNQSKYSYDKVEGELGGRGERGVGGGGGGGGGTWVQTSDLDS